MNLTRYKQKTVYLTPVDESGQMFEDSFDRHSNPNAWAVQQSISSEFNQYYGPFKSVDSEDISTLSIGYCPFGGCDDPTEASQTTHLILRGLNQAILYDASKEI